MREKITERKKKLSIFHNLFQNAVQRDPRKRRVKPVQKHLIQVDFGGADDSDDSDFELDKHKKGTYKQINNVLAGLGTKSELIIRRILDALKPISDQKTNFKYTINTRMHLHS